jgi:uncharacterized delta-60 repeat protein
MSRPKHARRPARRPRVGLLTLLVAWLVFSPLTLAAAGDLDASFDGDGKVITDFGKNEYAHGMAIQGDGKIVVVGGDTELDPPRYYRDFILARYLSDGSLDPRFGGGRVRTDFAGGSDEAYGVVEQRDGKLVVAGWTAAESRLQFAFVRYNPDASLDPTFDGDGKAVVSAELSWQALAVALQPDGRVVAAGEACDTSSCDFALARLNPNGSIDTSFDADGMVLTDLSGGVDLATSLALQADGKIIAAGIASPSGDVLLVRYGANGSLDPSFDGDGKVRTSLSCCAIWPRLAVQSDGKILVAAGPELLRYNVDGSLDPAFGTNGRVSTTENSTQAVALQPDGKIVVAGSPRNVALSGFVVSRYAKDGSDDPNFNSSLVSAETPVGLPVAGVGLQSDRKIVLAGSTGPETPRRSDFIVLRFLNPAPPAARCRVPNVRGKTLGVARRSIRRARCSVGKVTRKTSRRVKKGRIISQRPSAGRLLPVGTKIKLIVSVGRHR